MLAKDELVYAKDGKLLGRVAELRGEYFKVSAPNVLDYWLPRDSLELRDDAVLMTSFAEADLEKYKREAGSL